MWKIQFIIIVLSFISCHDKQKSDILITNVNIIDLETGNISIGNVSIRDSIIIKIADRVSRNHNNEKIIDGTGCYLIPGLWDMHVHIQDSSYLSMFLDFGITGIRDMGGCVNQATDGCESVCPSYLNNWKKAIRDGSMEGPQMYIAGNLLSGTGWPTSLPVFTLEEVSKAFERNIEENVDFIKVYEKIPWESYKEIAILAKLYNLDFVGHVSEPFLLSDILDLGQKSIEHIREPILYSFTEDSTELENFMIADNYTQEDREFVNHWINDAENVIQSFKNNDAWFTPTMAVQYSRQRYDDELWINHPLRQKLPASVTEGLSLHLEKIKLNEDKTGDSLWWMALTKLVKRFNNEEINLLAGSDIACQGGIPGYSLHEELFLMVNDAGLSPLDAIRTATINPCSYFELKNRGNVKVGYYADLILLNENPLDNIQNTLSIQTVIINGRIVKSKSSEEKM